MVAVGCKQIDSFCIVIVLPDPQTSGKSSMSPALDSIHLMFCLYLFFPHFCLTISPSFVKLAFPLYSPSFASVLLPGKRRVSQVH